MIMASMRDCLKRTIGRANLKPLKMNHYSRGGWLLYLVLWMFAWLYWAFGDISRSENCQVIESINEKHSTETAGQREDCFQQASEYIHTYIEICIDLLRVWRTQRTISN